MASPKNTPPLSCRVKELFEKEMKYTSGGFIPIPAFFTSGVGSILTDVDGNKKIDFLSMFSAANLGQQHPKLTQAMHEAYENSTMLSLACRGPIWVDFAESICNRFGYEKVTAMVSGAEAADTACKVARKWGTKFKKISPDEILVLGVSENYHGLTSGTWPLMTPSKSRDAYALRDKVLTNVNPSTGTLLRYGHIEDMEECLKELGHRVAGVIMECIHGHLEKFEDEIAYATAVRQLCKKYNVLFISDEVRMGSAKTGKFLCSDWLGPENKPDIIALGKSISGGAYPASYILGSNETVGQVEPYESASTFAPTAVGLAAVNAALKIYDEEKLADRSAEMQRIWEAETSKWNHPFVQFITARGSDFNITLKRDYHNKRVDASRLAMLILHKGVFLYPMDNRLRMSVAMTITDEIFLRGIAIIKEGLDEIEQYDVIAGAQDENSKTATPWATVNE
ncbi:hypothetical protein OIDMADRAFT_139383 [Oidiodendron maius Zn]|uniref:Ornithine aminotransferase n=1 Tax=Oidiodendron maius (strain Zn) TaxID=913774 RepID=A0A0C3CSJ5_OIDMZ|nr:hypothetical protein OIDMADRAFT_139383 [Oidiodendron maius Zn]